MDKKVKILIVGNGVYSIYEEALYNAFQELGYKNTELFAYEDYIEKPFIFNVNFLWSLIYKFQNKFSIGYGVNQLNSVLLEKCKIFEPDLVFLYRCRAIYPKTIKSIKEMGSIVFSYNNDNPFSNYYPKFFWRHYKNSIPLCDLNFVYRESNIKECKEYGSKRTEILRSYYMENRNFPILEKERINNIPDILFLGHYEKDIRKEYLEALAESGVIVGLPSTWKGIICDKNIVFLENTGNQYNTMLNSTKIALVFLSTLNKDTYTRRCFEIPATKTMMLSVYTEDLTTMFEGDKEAVFFETKEELIDKAKYYLKHDEEREKIGQAGYQRLIKDGHEVKDRAVEIINYYNEIIGR